MSTEQAPTLIQERAASTPVRWPARGFRRQVTALFQQFVRPGCRVLAIGCGRGELLRALEPSRGLGLDPDPLLIRAAGEQGPGSPCEFRTADVTPIVLNEDFDFIVLDFVVTALPDVQACFAQLRAATHARTRLVLTSVNNVWTPLIVLGRWIGLVAHRPPGNWLATKDLDNLLRLAGWEVVHQSTELLLPLRIPLLASFFNGFVVRLPGFRHLGSTLHLVARPVSMPPVALFSCSVVVPARNEAGNIAAALQRIPVMGTGTEVIFVEGGSRDETWATLQSSIASYRGPLNVKVLQQPGTGKWDAVRAGFFAATGEVLMILDADLTVPPEELPKFYDAIASGTAEFANGSRLIYPMEREAMRFLNLIANKCFALLLSFVLGQSIKDSLCGTKVLLRRDYDRVLLQIERLGDFDPFGDFNLLFGAAMLKLKIRDIPIRYRQRTYGSTNISRFRHGWLLLKMTVFGLVNVKFRWK